MFLVLSSWLRVIARVHPVHAMNAEQRHMAADLWTRPTDLSHNPVQCCHAANAVLPRRPILGNRTRYQRAPTLNTKARRYTQSFSSGLTANLLAGTVTIQTRSSTRKRGNLNRCIEALSMTQVSVYGFGSLNNVTQYRIKTLEALVHSEKWGP